MKKEIQTIGKLAEFECPVHSPFFRFQLVQHGRDGKKIEFMMKSVYVNNMISLYTDNKELEGREGRGRSISLSHSLLLSYQGSSSTTM